MGNHYIPRHYLRSFEDPNRPGSLWLFDKCTGKTTPAAISKVAQEANFYDDEIERELADKVEGPANPVITKLCAGERISVTERHQLSVYIAVMLKRIPSRRDEGMKLVPEVIESTLSKIERVLERAEANPKFDLKVVRRRQDELQSLRTKYQEETPSVLIQELRTPHASEEIVDLIERMTWRLIESIGQDSFLTTDNPAFFFSAYGLGRPESELSFPLSPKRALHGSWQGGARELHFLKAKSRIVREVNKRLASTARRFAFYHQNAAWMHNLLRKQHPFLSRIMWR